MTSQRRDAAQVSGADKKEGGHLPAKTSGKRGASHGPSIKASGRRAITGALVLALAGSPVLGPAVEARAAESQQMADGVTAQPKKDETIYVKADGTGAVTGTYVVNMFESNEATSVSDPADYASVTNLSTTQDLSQENGTVKLDVPADAPTYYQGDLTLGTELPWDVRVSYTLDGKDVSPSELSGASGKLTVKLSVTAKADSANKNLSDFANSCVVQATGTFPEDHFTLEDAGDLTAAHAGSDTVLTAMVLPGESKTFEVTGDARDFEYSGWQIAAMPLSMSVDIASETKELTDQTDELADATSSLADGSQSLSDALGEASTGSGTLDSGAASLSQGASELSSGTGELASGANDLAEGTGALASGASSAEDGANRVSEGASQLAQGLQQLDENSSSLNEGAKSLSDGASQLSAGASSLKDGADQLREKASAGAGEAGEAQAELESAQGRYASAMGKLQAAVSSGDKQAAAAAMEEANAAVEAIGKASGNAGAAQALAGVSEGAQGLSEGAGQVAKGAKALESGASSLSEGIASYTGAAGKLAEGSGQVANGSKDLANGVSDLADGARSADAGSNALASGAASVNEGAQALSDGSAQVASGADSLSSGLAQAHAGSLKLSDGAAELADATSGLGDKVVDELQDRIDEKLGKGYEAHSFVAPSNTNVDRVQFVYILDGVTKPDKPAAQEQEQKSESVWDRLLALFGISE